MVIERNLPDITVPAGAVVMIVGPLGTQVAQVEIYLFHCAEAAHGHGARWSLLSVQTSVVAFDVGVTANAIRYVKSRLSHAHSLLGQVASRSSSKLPIVVVGHFSLT